MCTLFIRWLTYAGMTVKTSKAVELPSPQSLFLYLTVKPKNGCFELAHFHWNCGSVCSGICKYVKDDKIVYHGYEVLEGVDAKTFKVVGGQKWDAEDKNRKYGQRM